LSRGNLKWAPSIEDVADTLQRVELRLLDFVAGDGRISTLLQRDAIKTVPPLFGQSGEQIDQKFIATCKKRLNSRFAFRYRFGKLVKVLHATRPKPPAETWFCGQARRKTRSVSISPWLFCNRRGECYFNGQTGRAGGWDTMWRNFMMRVLKETKGKEPFTEHDMRAKCASDAETLEHAQALLAHADGKITERVYRRKPERVMPLR
jgi:hypothetical protein